MADPLADARLKLKRAHEHLQSTDSAFYWFNRDKPYRIVAEPNQEGTHKVVKVRFQGLSIERLAVISADANTTCIARSIIWRALWRPEISFRATCGIYTSRSGKVKGRSRVLVPREQYRLSLVSMSSSSW
jgi:hypothetical protein